ncbi:MAG: MMPL family transporter, partial [Gammaproteobacteria bacterium]|nr:MMPL family transporter [Gammaproteobacteria bacterium]
MVSTVIVVALSVLAAMGTAGWLGIKLTPPSMSAPTLILTLAVADCIHFLVTLYHNLRGGMQKQAAIVESLRINFSPIMLTSLTTAIGFLSMNFSDAPPFRDLGNITAVGVVYAFLLAVFFLPALAAVLPLKAKQRKTRTAMAMDSLATFVINTRRPLFWGMLAVIVGLSVFAPRNQLDDNFVNYFDESIPFRVETDLVTDNLSGMYLIDYSISSGEEGGVSNPAFLAKVEEFERWLESQPEVQHVSSITETMRRLNRSMHGDDDNYYLLPESRELSAQYLLLYEMSLPYGLDLNNQINFDKSTTRLSATLETLSTQETLDFEKRSDAWMAANTPEIATAGSGPTVMFSHISFRNIISMLSGTTIAIVLISAILMIALRSLKFGMLSLIPNLTPALMAFGVWYLTVGYVGLAVSVVVAMTLGIVVDDTIHFLSKYLRARRERGLNAEEAVRYAFNTVGVALLVTTIVLVCGFLVYAQSAFLVNAEMGLLTAITIAIALIVDFLFLPTLLIAIDGDKETDSETATADPSPVGQNA